jgi:hypothetical protein
MSKTSENKVAKLLQKTLPLEFECTRFKLGESGKWGEVDKVSKVCPNKYVFLEVEEGQTHPDTNVLKVWPYLQENRRVRIFLIQVFLPKCLNKSKSRVLLSEWTACEIEKRFPRAFQYWRIAISGDINKINKSRSLKKQFKEFLSDGC